MLWQSQTDNQEYGLRISVVIPVYNVSGYIERCIESLKDQTLADLEFIFVDDCSTDDSMAPVEAWAAEDERVHTLYNEKNIGSGPSRNRGIELARGEYLSFIDPDDYLADDFMELLYVEAHSQHYDIVKGSIVRKRIDGSTANIQRSPNQLIRDCLSDDTPLYMRFTYEHQSAIFRRAFLLSENVRYGSSSRAQDTSFLLQACSRAQSFSVLDEAVYYFCEREGSAMHSLDSSKLAGVVQSVHEQIDYVLARLADDKKGRYYIRNQLMGCLVEYSRYSDWPDTDGEIARCLSDMRDELLRLPFCDSLCNSAVMSSFSLRVLRDYGEALPIRSHFSPWEQNNPPIRYARLAKRWIAFYLTHPEEAEACRGYLVSMCSNAVKAAQGRPSSSYGRLERWRASLMLSAALRQLPKELRKEIKKRVS